MKANIKERWLAALRSGDYKQGTDRLRIENTFCCLGVLCDLYAQETKTDWIVDEIGNYEFLEGWGALPLDVQDWAQLPQIMGRYISSLNDEGKRFEELADLIEQEIPSE